MALARTWWAEARRKSAEDDAEVAAWRADNLMTGSGDEFYYRNLVAMKYGDKRYDEYED